MDTRGTLTLSPDSLLGRLLLGLELATRHIRPMTARHMKAPEVLIRPLLQVVVLLLV